MQVMLTAIKILNATKKVVDNVKTQLLSGEKNIIGIMLESNLVEGNQKINSREKLTYAKRN